MANHDIMPFRGQAGSTGSPDVLHFRMAASTTSATEDSSWNAGEVMVLASGEIEAAYDGAVDPALATVYISAAGSAGLIQTEGGTSGAAAHDITVPVYDPRDGSEFVTANVYNNSDTELVVGTLTVGTTCGFWVDDSDTANHKHGLDTNGTGVEITRIIDALGRDAAISGATATRVVFRRGL